MPNALEMKEPLFVAFQMPVAGGRAQSALKPMCHKTNAIGKMRQTGSLCAISKACLS